MYFFALSQAPPVFAAEMANCTPLTIAPGRKPARMTGPKRNPKRRGEKMTYVKKEILEFQAQSSLSKRLELRS